MTAAGLVPVVPQRSADSGQYSPPPPGSARPALNDQLSSQYRATPQWPTFDGSHGLVPDGPVLHGPTMDPYPMYSPSLSGLGPVTDFWDEPCECDS